MPEIDNSRNGKVYLVKLVMTTKNGRINDYTFMKVESFVNFEPDEYESAQQLKRQVQRKIHFYEELYHIRVESYRYNILHSQRVQFLRKPYFKSYTPGRRRDEQEM